MSLPVHDPEIGLNYVAKNKNLYVKVLGKFVEQQAGAAQAVQQALAEADFETAHRLVHTLKGLAGSMGMPQLQQTATEVDAQFKEGLHNSDLLPRLISDLDEAMATANQYLAANRP